jgi:hypothetical protein
LYNRLRGYHAFIAFTPEAEAFEVFDPPDEPERYSKKPDRSPEGAQKT